MAEINEELSSSLEQSSTHVPDLSITAGERVEERKETAKELSRDMFSKIADYIDGELSATCDEYDLLQRLNQITIAKYNDMTKLAGGLTEVGERLNEKFISLQQYCDQIDEIVSRVSDLEQMAYRLDKYAKHLEQQFKTLEKR